MNNRQFVQMLRAKTRPPHWPLSQNCADRIEAILKEREWQPIETAPKGTIGETGPVVLVWDGRDMMTAVAEAWSDKTVWYPAIFECHHPIGDGWREEIFPTHWMPLPEPPHD